MLVACPSCTRRLNVPDEAAGQAGQCPWCKSPFRMPAPPAVPAVPAMAAFPVAAATIPMAMSPTTVIPVASLSIEPVAVPIVAGGDGAHYPLAADPQDDAETRRRKAKIWRDAAKTADAEHRKRNPAGLSDLVWGFGFLGLMMTYIGLIAVSLKLQTSLPLLVPGILIGMAGAIAVIVVAFCENVIEGVLCLPGLPWGLAGLLFPVSAPLAIRFAFWMAAMFGNDIVSEVLTWTLIAVLCIAFPCYLPNYVLKNFEAAFRPLYLMLIGILYQITAVLLIVNGF
jgi:hypothetical protein